MLDEKGFDFWAGNYDEYIANSKGYPFEGYYEVLTCVYNQIDEIESKNILDIGFGTGKLTNKLYEKGANIYGIDFSNEMIKIASEQMPNGVFIQHDFNTELPKEVSKIDFDYVVSTYAFHHLDNHSKIKFIVELKKLIRNSGKIIIGDISFKTVGDLKKLRDENGDGWDYDEIYVTEEEFSPMLNDVNGIKYTYVQISNCAGVYVIYPLTTHVAEVQGNFGSKIG